VKTQINADKIKRRLTQIIILSTIYYLLSTITGCEAFVRKFTRKPKKPEVIEEPVLVPQIYPESSYPAQNMYKDYYFLFRSWMDELVNHLEPSANRKKQIDCIKEAKENLLKMHSILKEEKQKELESYIEKLEEIEDQLKGFLSQYSLYSLKNQSMSLKSKISKDFSYTRIKNFIK
jgi:hypothetical protein